MTDYERQLCDACNSWLFREGSGGQTPFSQVILDKWETFASDMNWLRGLRPIIERYHPHVLDRSR